MSLAIILRLIAGFALVNEIRGIVMAAPILYGLWQTGGTWVAWLIAICSLAGIVLTVAVPLWLANRLQREPT